MPNCSRALLIVVTAFCAILAGIGCASTSVIPIGDTKLTTIPLGNSPIFEAPSYYSSAPYYIDRISDSSFVVIKTPVDTAMRVEKYDASGTLRWSTPIAVSPLSGSMLFPHAEMWEKTAEVIHDDNHLTLITSRRLYDSFYVTGRVFDLANGATIRTRNLDVITQQMRTGSASDAYQYFTALDTAHIIAAVYEFDSNHNAYTMRIMVITPDLTSSSTCSIALDGEKSVGSVKSIWINDAGNLDVLSLHDPGTIRLDQYNAATGALIRSSSTQFTDASDNSVHPKEVMVIRNDLGEIMVFGAMRDGDELVGMDFAKIDRSGTAFTPPSLYTIPEEKLTELIDDDDYDDGVFRTVIDNGEGRYIMIFEQEEQRQGEGKFPSTEFRTGDVLMLAFDHDGRPTWQQAMRKSSEWSTTYTNFRSISPSISLRDTLRVIYRDPSGLAVVNYKMDDGSEISGSSRHIVDMGGAALNESKMTGWLGDETMFFLLRQGTYGLDWSVGIVHVR